MCALVGAPCKELYALHDLYSAPSTNHHATRFLNTRVLFYFYLFIYLLTGHRLLSMDFSRWTPAALAEYTLTLTLKGETGSSLEQTAIDESFRKGKKKYTWSAIQHEPTAECNLHETRKAEYPGLMRYLNVISSVLHSCYARQIISSCCMLDWCNLTLF